MTRGCPDPADRYATRLGCPRGPVARAEPVVHGGRAGPLDAAQLAAFDADGFLSLSELCGPREVAELLAEVERLAGDPALQGSERVVTEPGGLDVRSVFEVHRLSPRIADLVADPRLAEMARQIVGSDVYIHQSRVNRKPGFVGKEFAWHSDFETWHAEDGMPTARAVSVSIALTPNYVSNGSLMLVPGSHRVFVPTVGSTPPDHYRTSLRQQQVGVPDQEALTALVEQRGIFTATGLAGSAVIFDANVMHGSSSNITPYPRTNVFVVYNSVENALREPFAAGAPRPTFVASRDFSPVGQPRP